MIDDILNEADSKMDKSVEAAREEFAAIRAGRAQPSMFNKILVDYYGTPTPLQQLASFTAPEARIILISPYDMGAMANIEKAIRDSDLGVNPSNDGKVLRCVFPELTEERRKEYIKVARTKAEDGRVAVRNLRRTAKQAPGEAREGRRGRQGRRDRRREAARRHHQEAHRRDRRHAEEQGSRAHRGMSTPAAPELDPTGHPRRHRPRTTAGPVGT